MSPLTKTSDRDLFDILVAVAWIDGQLQTEERELLTKIATERNFELSEDLLSDRRNSSPDKCYQLLKKYLGENSNPEARQNLLDAVSSLIYSDNDIAIEEAELLTQMQNIDPQEKTANSTLEKLVTKIQQIYRQGVRDL